MRSWYIIATIILKNRDKIEANTKHGFKKYMKNILVNLKIIKTEKSILHEEYDSKRVKKIKKRFLKEKVLLNPIDRKSVE